MKESAKIKRKIISDPITVTNTEANETNCSVICRKRGTNSWQVPSNLSSDWSRRQYLCCDWFEVVYKSYSIEPIKQLTACAGFCRVEFTIFPRSPRFACASSARRYSSALHTSFILLLYKSESDYILYLDFVFFVVPPTSFGK